MKRVVVTGLGATTSLGVSVETLRNGLFEGRSGIDRISAFDPSSLRSQIAGEASDFRPEEIFDRKTLRRTARFSQLALAAAREAIAQSGLGADPRREEFAVAVGSGIGGFDFLEQQHEQFLTAGPGKFAPLTVPIILPNMAAGLVAIDSGWAGPNLAISTACATGSQTIGTALDWIRLGRAEVVIAGGSESSISPFAVDGYCQIRALSTRNDDPQGASRPFSADRDGFVIAEGAAMLVLEELSRAQARGAEIFAELIGYGTTADAFHATAPSPDGRGARRAMAKALEDAGCNVDEVDLINAHGTATELNDATETRAIRDLFGPHADRLMVQATKSMTGHALGAAGAIEAVSSVLALHHQVVHPTLNLHVADPKCDLDYVSEGSREAELDVVLSNSFGFGGHNSVLVFRRLD